MGDQLLKISPDSERRVLGFQNCNRNMERKDNESRDSRCCKVRNGRTRRFIGCHNITNLWYADDTRLLAETEKGLKMLLNRVKKKVRNLVFS